MAASSTAQVVFKGNTADLQKKLKVAEKGMQEFKDMGSDALSSIGDLFGVNTGKIGDMLGSVKKLSAGFQAMGSTGGAAFAGLSKGAAALAGGVAAIGIAGLVAGFKELNRQAEMLASTDAGQTLVDVGKAWRDTYAMSTAQAGQGGASVLVQREQFKVAGQRAATIFGDAFKGVLLGQGIGQSVRSAIEADKKAVADANFAAPYQKALSEAIIYRRNQSMAWAEMDTQIKQYERTAKDVSKSQTERDAALQKAIDLTTKKGEQQAAAYQKIYEAQRDLNKATENSAQATEAAVSAYNEWQGVLQDTEGRLTSLDRVNNRINKGGSGGEASKTAKEVDHLGEAIKSLHSSVEGAVNVNKVFGDTQDELKVSADAYRSALEGIVATYGTEDERIKTLIDKYKELEKARDDAANVMTRIEVPTATVTSPLAQKQAEASNGLAGWKMPELTEEQQRYYNFLQGMVDASEKANEAIRDALVDGISGSIQYLADCFMGLEEFNGAGLLSALLTPLANVAVEMGEILIAQGIGVEACKKALESLNGYAAIAAGVALVTIGAAAKAGLRSAVNHATTGGYSTSVASSAYTSGSNNLSTFGREMEVKVTGTLTANGSQLVAVLNNEHNRNSYTT